MHQRGQLAAERRALARACGGDPDSLRGLPEAQAEEVRDWLAAGYNLGPVAAGHRTLTGVDDQHAFAVQVPATCATIGEALEWLRPDGVCADTPRQGEYFFARRDPPAEGSESVGRRSHRYTRHVSARFSRTHNADEVIRVETAGETAFCGRRSIKTHGWTGRDRYFARGVVRHEAGDHPDFDLGAQWHEVIPNRAHGPWPVRAPGRDVD